MIYYLIMEGYNYMLFMNMSNFSVMHMLIKSRLVCMNEILVCPLLSVDNFIPMP